MLIVCKAEGTANPCTSTGITKARPILHSLFGRFWDDTRICAYAGMASDFLCINYYQGN